MRLRDHKHHKHQQDQTCFPDGARRVVQFLRSSDQRREGLRKFIEDGNSRGWFTGKDDDGKRIVLHIPQLELLRDVKMRWDSVYMMLERLRQLRPVGFSQ